MESVGANLATEVSVALERGLIVTYCHKDYCGVGLRYDKGTFIYDESHDSTVATDEDLLKWQEQPSIQRKTFSSRGSFVEWLALQTDESLSGAEFKDSNPWLTNNQRLTVQRLRAAAKFAQSTPPEKWERYAG